MDKGSGGFSRVLVGLAVAAVGLFGLLAVLSHSAFDPSLAGNFPVNVPMHNLCGMAGAYFASLLLWAHGVGAYVLPVALAWWGLAYAASAAGERLGRSAVGAAVLVATVSAGAAVLQSSGFGPCELFAAVKSVPGAGGQIGRAVGGEMTRFLGPVGPYMVLAIALVASGVLISRERSEKALGLVGRSMLAIVGLAPWREVRGPAAALDEEDLDAIRGRTRAPAEPDADEGSDDSAEEDAGDEDEEGKDGDEAADEPEAEPVIRVAGEPADSARLAAEDAEKLAGKLAAESRGHEGGGAESKEKPQTQAASDTSSKDEDAVVNTYMLPPVELLEKDEHRVEVTSEALTRRGAVLVQMLREFRIETKLVAIDRGPTVTMYELELAPGIKVQQVLALADNIAMAMKATNVRIVAPIPGRSTVGVEIPNSEAELVRMRPIIESPEFSSTDYRIPLIIGRDSSGHAIIEDLTRMPHLLIAGATGSGKSVCINSIIVGILMHRDPTEVKLLLVDPKMVEMTMFRDIPHLVSPVVSDMKRAAGVLDWATREMDGRYSRLNAVGARDIVAYNRLSPDERTGRLPKDENPDEFRSRMPYIVIIIDELADLMMVASKEIEGCITRLAQKSRSVGIHIVLATQRPSVDVITGLIKANMPARISFQVTSKVDSRTILDQNGADKLVGRGDMLFLPPTSGHLIRAKGTYVSDEELTAVVDFIRSQAKPELVGELDKTERGEDPDAAEEDSSGHDDPLFNDSVDIILQAGRGSVSLLQRRLAIGYTRAAKLIDMMADRNILGPHNGSKAREILLTFEAWERVKAGEMSLEKALERCRDR